MLLQGRVTQGKSYIRRYKPQHPNATKQGHVYEHRLVMEEFLGRLLTSNEVVHHKDGNKRNNNLSNLQLVTKQEHKRIHAQEDALKVCGDSSKMKCAYCKKYDDPENMYVRKEQYQSWHRECSNKYKRVSDPKTGPYKYDVAYKQLTKIINKWVMDEQE